MNAGPSGNPHSLRSFASVVVRAAAFLRDPPLPPPPRQCTLSRAWWNGPGNRPLHRFRIPRERGPGPRSLHTSEQTEMRGDVVGQPKATATSKPGWKFRVEATRRLITFPGGRPRLLRGYPEVSYWKSLTGPRFHYTSFHSIRSGILRPRVSRVAAANYARDVNARLCRVISRDDRHVSQTPTF